MTLKTGQRIRIRHSIDRREGAWERVVEGTIISVKAEPTGSWYAHGKDDKLWLQRVVLRKADGELTSVAIDPATSVELLESGAAS